MYVQIIFPNLEKKKKFQNEPVANGQGKAELKQSSFVIGAAQMHTLGICVCLRIGMDAFCHYGKSSLICTASRLIAFRLFSDVRWMVAAGPTSSVAKLLLFW